MKEYTIKQIAQAVGQTEQAIRSVLSIAKVKFNTHPEVSPNLRFFNVKNLPAKYQKALGYEVEITTADNEVTAGMTDNLGAQINEKEEKDVVSDVATTIDTVDDTQEIYDESTPPIGELPPLTPELIYAFRDIFGTEQTRNILMNNYQINPS